MFDVIGLGENSVDLVYRVPSFPQPEGWRSKMRLAGHAVSCGGRVTTTLAGCARLGLRTAYLGVIGSDANGQQLRKALLGRGIDLSEAQSREVANRFAVIVVAEDSGERAVLWDRDLRLSVDSARLPVARIRAARLLHVDDDDARASLEAAAIARDAGVPVTSDVDRLTPETEALIGRVTYPIFAEGLLAEFTGIADPERAMRKLRATHDGLLVVTLGSRGAAALDGDRFLYVPAFPVTAIDTTAAGDVFRSGFIYGLLNGYETDRLLRFANAAAAAACCRAGAMDSVPGIEEIERLLT